MAKVSELHPTSPTETQQPVTLTTPVIKTPKLRLKSKLDLGKGTGRTLSVYVGNAQLVGELETLLTKFPRSNVSAVLAQMVPPLVAAIRNVGINRIAEVKARVYL